MLKKAALILLAAIVVCTASCAKSSIAVASESPNISAQGAALLELTTNSVLFSKNAHERLPMASTTKVMTALLAVESGKLNSMVTVCDEAYGVEGSSIYLYEHEKISLQDLTYGLMLRSGNDAAVAIAVYLGGSVSAFCGMMNARAKELGCSNTSFSNPHGLTAENHYTSAYDLALICSAAMKNTTFRQIVGTKYYTTSGEVSRSMMNKNKLLWSYDGALGIKTGYTEAAGKCLTFCAEQNGMTVVGVVLNCPNMFPDAATLMNYAFDNYEMCEALKAGSVVMRISVKNSDGTLLALCTEYSAFVPVRKDAEIKLTPQIVLADNIEAPIASGQSLGVVALYCDGKFICSVPLIAQNEVNTVGIGYYLKRIFMFW